MRFRDIKLQPVRIPTGWLVSFNIFFEIDPAPSATFDDEPHRSVMGLFVQDMLQISHERFGLVIDLGWYPDEDPSGCIRLVMIRDQEWQDPIVEFASRDRVEVVRALEKMLLDASARK